MLPSCVAGAMDWEPIAAVQACQQPADMLCLKWQGLLPTCSIMDAIALAEEGVAEGRSPWAAVMVWGFADAPISWHGAEHAHSGSMSGENDYMVLILPGGDEYMIMVSAGEGDGFAHF